MKKCPSHTWRKIGPTESYLAVQQNETKNSLNESLLHLFVADNLFGAEAGTLSLAANALKCIPKSTQVYLMHINESAPSFEHFTACHPISFQFTTSPTIISTCTNKTLAFSVTSPHKNTDTPSPTVSSTGTDIMTMLNFPVIPSPTIRSTCSDTMILNFPVILGMTSIARYFGSQLDPPAG